MQEYVERVRRFNRTVTQRVGALHEDYLARNRPLGASRLLWEIGQNGCDVRALRQRLGLDAGYVSRLLRELEGEGLVDVVPSERDRRVRVARLTVRGRAERRLLDRRSDALAAALLAPLSPRQRGDLVAAMTCVDRLLTAALVRVDVVDPVQRRGSSVLAVLLRRARRPLRRRVRCCREPVPRRRRDASTRRAVRGGPPPRRGDRLRRAEVAGRRAGVHQADVGRPVCTRLVGRPQAAQRAGITRRGPRRNGRPPGDEPCPRRGHLAVPIVWLRRGPAVQQRAVRPPLVREATELSDTRQHGRSAAPRLARKRAARAPTHPAETFTHGETRRAPTTHVAARCSHESSAEPPHLRTSRPRGGAMLMCPPRSIGMSSLASGWV